MIHEALGCRVPAAYEGRPIGSESPRRIVLAEHEVAGDVIVGARSTEWLYEADGITGQHRLFDCREGGFEHWANGDGDMPEDATEVREAALDRLSQLDVEAYQIEGTVEDDVESRLQDLGYL